MEQKNENIRNEGRKQQKIFGMDIKKLTLLNEKLVYKKQNILNQ